MCGGLLGFGDIGASILAIVNALPSPSGFRRECVDDLRKGISKCHKLMW